MPDYVPEDMDAYVERAERLNRIIDIVDNKDVDDAMENLAIAARRSADTMMGVGGIESAEVVTAVVGIVAGFLAEWYAHVEYDEGDDE